MTNDLKGITRLAQHLVLESTTRAGSGHPTSCLSATEALVALFFGGAFRAHLADPKYPTNDRFILSKGHAAPLLYAIYAIGGAIEMDDLLTLRRQGSLLEGHPTSRWPYAALATGSLGQGLAAGVGFALDARWRQAPQRVFVLLGDGEMMEGSNVEAMTLAAHEGLGNLIAAVDVNGLGQRGATIWERDLARWRALGEAVGWRVMTARDGHDGQELAELWTAAAESDGRPTLLILPTVKGHGVSFLADAPDRHGKVLTTDELARALAEIGNEDANLRGTVTTPSDYVAPPDLTNLAPEWPTFAVGDSVSTREAIGRAVAAIAQADGRVAVLDAEVANSTFFSEAAEALPDRFVECFIAEQTMVGVATGLARAGRQPWLATFAAFLTRAGDQLRMANYSQAALKIVGTHAGVSIGEDGPSQMGLEDIALFRSLNATVLYPADGNAAVALTRLAAETPGTVYLRATRGATADLYPLEQSWRVGGSQLLRHSDRDVATVITAGVTVAEALRAADQLQAVGLSLRVIDAYSIQPLDEETVWRAARETGLLVVVEDHRPAGGLGEAVALTLQQLGVGTPLIHLAVRENPASATPAEQLAAAGLDAAAIVKSISEHLKK